MMRDRRDVYERVRTQRFDGQYGPLYLGTSSCPHEPAYATTCQGCGGSFCAACDGHLTPARMIDHPRHQSCLWSSRVLNHV